jgi:hypothetical protein
MKKTQLMLGLASENGFSPAYFVQFAKAGEKESK